VRVGVTVELGVFGSLCVIAVGIDEATGVQEVNMIAKSEKISLRFIVLENPPILN
jgi:hypothetical protein